MRPEPYPDIPRAITCIDCGERAFLITHLPEDDFYPGEILVYRCEACLDRWDVIYEPAEDGAGDMPSGTS